MWITCRREKARSPCSFWLADCYALSGRRDEAVALFERLLALRKDVGLPAEEYDPHARRMLGDFPQTLTHMAPEARGNRPSSKSALEAVEQWKRRCVVLRPT